MFRSAFFVDAGLDETCRPARRQTDNKVSRRRRLGKEREFMSRTIIIGYGNIDRSDDGLACEVINLVRQDLGQKILEDGDMGLENLDGEIDSIFLPQLVPEIMDCNVEIAEVFDAT